MTKITYIPGEIANAAIDEHGNRKPVTRTQHIFDDAKGKSQAEVNKEFSNAIGGLNNQNYVTVDSFNALPATGAVDTVYRVSNWDGTQQDPSVYSEYAWDGSQYVHLSTKTQIGEVFDISAYHATGGTLATYADLSAALDSNNGGGVPQSLQKGGMRIQFVHSIDNKYVQFRCIADEFTTDTTQWAIAEEGVYVENPEFIYVKTDAEDKILWAVRTNGDIFYGAGVPSQVVNYINDKIADLSLDEYEDIVAFLNDLEKGDKTLQDLLNEKVDKEEGKSLIDAEYASSIQFIENPEFTAVWLDNEEHILFGVQTDGNFLFGCGVPQQVKDYVEEKISSLSLDEYEDMVSFLSDYLGSDTTLKAMIDGINAAIEDKLDKDGLDPDALATVQAVENPEFLDVELDAEDKVLGGRKIDGTKFENNDVELNGNATVGGSLEVDGTVIKNIEDPENRSEITLDAEKKIINYRKEDGTLVENVGIETPNITAENISAKEVNIEGGEATLEKAILNSLELTNEGMTEFQQALKDSGFKPGGGGDYSDTITEKGKKPVFIPTPRLAMVNIIWDGNLSNLSKSDRQDGVQKVNYDVKVPIEFFDGQGVYFKKYALMSAQGNSSMAFIKKNISLKFFDTEDVEGKKKKWGKGDTFGTVFGDWVMQKTYHLKAFYTDFIRGSSEIAYQLADEVYKTRGVYADRPWKKALIDFSKITSATPAGLSEDGVDDMNLQIDNGARCMPDGFPVIVYQNGEFYGIYVWMLKKDADNFNMDTSNPLHIHLDGGLTVDSIWGGTINWGAFEIRNPEDLVCMDGSDYDGDFPAELIDETSEHYDSTDENHVRSAQVKQYIIDLSHRVGEINTLNSTNSVAAKELFDTYFDADNLIDYQLINMACGDTDGFGKNWQWTTWDGIKWYVNQYDKDMAFGNHFAGMYTRPVYSGWYGNNVSLPTGLAIRYYTPEHKTRWQGLVSAGIINAEHIKSLVTAWISRIGKDNYVQEWKKWPESPCNRDSYIDFENWDFDNAVRQYDYPEGMFWDETTTYDTGNVVWFSFTASFFAKFKAKKSNIGKCPLTDSYSRYPVNMGYRDSAWRFYKYIEETISNQNSFINSL